MSRSLWRGVVMIAVLAIGPNLHAADVAGVGPPLASTVAPGAGDATPEYLLPYRADRSPHRYLEWAWKDPVNLVTRPLYWRGDEWQTFAIDAGVTGVLMPADNDVRDLFQHNRSGGVDSTLNVVRDVTAGGGTYFLAGAALFGSGLFSHNEKLTDSGFLSFESVLYAGVLSQGIKLLTGRERPDSGKDQYHFYGPGGGPSNSAFVSGESTVAFAFASSVSEVWQNPWVTWPAYILAGAVSAQRIHDNRHWLSDVVGGAFLGEVVGKNIVHFHYRHDAGGVLQPYVTPESAGMKMTFRF